MLRNLLTTAPRKEPLIRLYPNYLRFNKAASDLLDLKPGDAVCVLLEDRDGYIYIGNHHNKQSYEVIERNNTFEVRSAPLCRKLAESLNGAGSYRICADETQEYMDHVYYNILKMKYGKD